MSESKSWFYSVTDIDGNEHHFPIVNITRLVWEPSSKAGFLFLNGIHGGIRIDRDCYIGLIARMATVEVIGNT